MPFRLVKCCLTSARVRPLLDAEGSRVDRNDLDDSVDAAKQGRLKGGEAERPGASPRARSTSKRSIKKEKRAHALDDDGILIGERVGDVVQGGKEEKSPGLLDRSADCSGKLTPRGHTFQSKSASIACSFLKVLFSIPELLLRIRSIALECNNQTVMRW